MELKCASDLNFRVKNNWDMFLIWIFALNIELKSALDLNLRAKTELISDSNLNFRAKNCLLVTELDCSTGPMASISIKEEPMDSSTMLNELFYTENSIKDEPINEATSKSSIQTTSSQSSSSIVFTNIRPKNIPVQRLVYPKVSLKVEPASPVHERKLQISLHSRFITDFWERKRAEMWRSKNKKERTSKERTVKERSAKERSAKERSAKERSA